VFYTSDKERDHLENRAMLERLAVAKSDPEELRNVSLDTLIPPSLIEKSLPWLAFFAVITGCFALAVSQALAIALMVFDPLFVCAYLYARSARRHRAQELSNHTLTTWSLSFNSVRSI
jgi:hypothetical protein